MHILYYITGHGYGHGVRSCVIGNAFSNSVTLSIRTSLPKSFFDEELKRPFRYLPAELDCGCVQHDGATVDVEATLKQYASIAGQNRTRISEEVELIQSLKADAVVSDITPFAFEAAYRAQIPSFAVSNFSWVDIYEPYVRNHTWFHPFLKEMRKQYGLADHLLRLQPSNAMNCFGNSIPVPLIAREGVNKTRQIKDRFNIAKEKKLALIYTGNYGMNSINWAGLKQYGDWAFIGVYPLAPSPSNYHLISKKEFPFQDLSASVDLIIGKIGYGLFGECMVNGVPLLYVPRAEFSEHEVLEKALRIRGFAYGIPRDRFYSLRWQKELEVILQSERPQRQSAGGGEFCAGYIEQHVFCKNT